MTRDGDFSFYASLTTYVRVGVFCQSTIHITLFITDTERAAWPAARVYSITAFQLLKGKLHNETVDDVYATKL